jgi:hypothetical protein
VGVATAAGDGGQMVSGATTSSCWGAGVGTSSTEQSTPYSLVASVMRSVGVTVLASDVDTDCRAQWGPAPPAGRCVKQTGPSHDREPPCCPASRG